MKPLDVLFSLSASRKQGDGCYGLEYEKNPPSFVLGNSSTMRETSRFMSANNWYACFALSVVFRISSDKSVCFGLLSSARSGNAYVLRDPECALFPNSNVFSRSSGNVNEHQSGSLYTVSGSPAKRYRRRIRFSRSEYCNSSSKRALFLNSPPISKLGRANFTPSLITGYIQAMSLRHRHFWIWNSSASSTRPIKLPSLSLNQAPLRNS